MAENQTKLSVKDKLLLFIKSNILYKWHKMTDSVEKEKKKMTKNTNE